MWDMRCDWLLFIPNCNSWKPECETTVNNINKFVNTAMRFSSDTFVVMCFHCMIFIAGCVFRDMLSSRWFYWLIKDSGTVNFIIITISSRKLNQHMVSIGIEWQGQWWCYERNTAVRESDKLGSIFPVCIIQLGWGDLVYDIQGVQMVSSVSHNNAAQVIKMTLSRMSKIAKWQWENLWYSVLQTCCFFL